MEIHDLKKEMELMGYKVTIEIYPFICGIEMILFEDFISVDRVRMTLTGRGWIVTDHEVKNRGKGFDDWNYFLLERNGILIELQSLFSNTSLNMKNDNDNFLGDDDEKKFGNS